MATEILSKGTCTWGYAELDFTPQVGFAMAGHATTGKVSDSIDPQARLFMRTLVLNPGSAGEVALCFMDLLSGSVALLVRVHELMPSIQNRIALVGTHTHYAPGNYFGNRFYDAFAQTNRGNPWARQTSYPLVQHLAQAIVTTVAQARSNAQAGHVGVVRSQHWKSGANRSYQPFSMNREAVYWNSTGMPGENPPADSDVLQRSIDPRVTTIVAVNETRSNICSFSTAASHTTCLGPYANTMYSADWPGIATQTVRNLAPGGVIHNAAFAMCAAGDVSSLELAGLHAGGGPGAGQSHELKQNRGREIGTHVSQTVQSALSSVATEGDPPVSISFRSIGWDPQRIFGRPVPGWPLAAGAEDGHGLRGLPQAREGNRRRRPLRPRDNRFQYPKLPIGRVLNRILGLAGAFDVAPVHPLCQIRIGSHVILSAPGELSTVSGYRAERSIVDSDPTVNSASVFVSTNDYMGYITTPEEYAMQHYEAGHTLFGNMTLPSFVQTHQVLLASTVVSPMSIPVHEGATEVGATASRDDGREQARKEQVQRAEKEIDQLVEELRKQPIIEVESVEQANVDSAEEYTEELAELERIANEWKAADGDDRTSSVPDGDERVAAPGDVESHEVYVSFLSDEEFDPKKIVFLRRGKETYESALIADFGDPREIGQEIRVALFVVPGDRPNEDELQFMLAP